MKDIINKKMIVIMILSFILLGLTSFAYELFTPNVQATISQPVGNISKNSSTVDEQADNLPSVTTEEISSKLEGKVYEIVYLLQKIGEPICVVIFIVCALVTLFGIFSRGGILKGVIGMVISGFVYFAIRYAPEIVIYIQNWAIS